MIILKEIVDFSSFEFKECLDIYKSSFPPNETRPIEKVVEMLKNDKDYHLLVTISNNFVIAIALLYIFKSLRIGLLDYLAVDHFIKEWE